MTLKKLKFLIIFHGPRALKDNWVISGVGEWKINIHKKKKYAKNSYFTIDNFWRHRHFEFQKKNSTHHPNAQRTS